MAKSDPFTRTPGVAGEAFIERHEADEIINSFKDSKAAKYIYKIVGLRGSGKTVELNRIIEEFEKETNTWKVYRISANGGGEGPVNALIMEMSKERFIDSKKRTVTTKGSTKADIKLPFVEGEAGGEVSIASQQNEKYYSAEVVLKDMVQKINDNGFRILIAVDDISKNDKMVEFLSILGTMIADKKKKIYFVCTGLSKNIEDFTKESSLTFFMRSDCVEIGMLNKHEIAERYQTLLEVDKDTAVSMAKLVQGYAYAYQVLGDLYFNKKKSDKLEDLLLKFDKILASDSYDRIWDSLPEGEKQLVKLIVKSESGNVTEIKKDMEKPGNFPELRKRLDKKHLIDIQTHGYIKINLPRFKDYILMWEDE